MRAYVRYIVRRVIAKDGNPVEWAILFRKVHPAFLSELLARPPAKSKPDDVRTRIEQTLLSKRVQMTLATEPYELAQGDGGNQAPISEYTAVRCPDFAAGQVNAFH